MSEILERALRAHGGRAQWQQIERMRVQFSAGGLLFVTKGQPRALHTRVADIEVHRREVTLHAFPVHGSRGVFCADRVRIERDGVTCAERTAPREAFAHWRRMLWWDALDLLYFAGYALWNYACGPFLLVEAGVEVIDLPPWLERGAVWQRLAARFPAEFPTHSANQVFYVDETGLVRRHDYTAEVVGRWARAAHYCDGYGQFGGLAMPTRRRVVPRRRDGRALSRPTLVWIDVADVTCARATNTR